MVYLVQQFKGRMSKAEYVSVDCVPGRLVVVGLSMVVELDCDGSAVEYEGKVERVFVPAHLSHNAPLLQIPPSRTNGTVVGERRIVL